MERLRSEGMSKRQQKLNQLSCLKVRGGILFYFIFWLEQLPFSPSSRALRSGGFLSLTTGVSPHAGTLRKVW